MKIRGGGTMKSHTLSALLCLWPLSHVACNRVRPESDIPDSPRQETAAPRQAVVTPQTYRYRSDWDPVYRHIEALQETALNLGRPPHHTWAMTHKELMDIADALYGDTMRAREFVTGVTALMQGERSTRHDDPISAYFLKTVFDQVDAMYGKMSPRPERPDVCTIHWDPRGNANASVRILKVPGTDRHAVCFSAYLVYDVYAMARLVRTLADVGPNYINMSSDTLWRNANDNPNVMDALVTLVANPVAVVKPVKRRTHPADALIIDAVVEGMGMFLAGHEYGHRVMGGEIDARADYAAVRIDAASDLEIVQSWQEEMTVDSLGWFIILQDLGHEAVAGGEDVVPRASLVMHGAEFMLTAMRLREEAVSLLETGAYGEPSDAQVKRLVASLNALMHPKSIGGDVVIPKGAPGIQFGHPPLQVRLAILKQEQTAPYKLFALGYHPEMDATLGGRIAKVLHSLLASVRHDLVRLHKERVRLANGQKG